MGRDTTSAGPLDSSMSPSILSLGPRNSRRRSVRETWSFRSSGTSTAPALAGSNPFAETVFPAGSTVPTKGVPVAKESGFGSTAGKPQVGDEARGSPPAVEHGYEMIDEIRNQRATRMLVDRDGILSNHGSLRT